MKPEEYVESTFKESIAIKEKFFEEHCENIIHAAQVIGTSLKNGGKVLIFGNGGSAADAQHMAAEMVGRMLVERRPLHAIALTTNSSNLTALGNDFGYEQIFAKQVEALAQKGDIIIAISTSGNSKNVLHAIQTAKQKECTVIGLTGGDGGALKEMCNITLSASLGKNSSRIQETHIFAIHSIVDILDRYFLDEPSNS